MESVIQNEASVAADVNGSAKPKSAWQIETRQ